MLLPMIPVDMQQSSGIAQGPFDFVKRNPTYESRRDIGEIRDQIAILRQQAALR